MGRVMAAGLMREVITVERETRVQRPDGGYDTSWVQVETVWAAVEPEATTDEASAGRMAGPIRYAITVYNATFERIIGGDRIDWNGLKLRLRSSPVHPNRALRVTVLADVETVEA